MQTNQANVTQDGPTMRWGRGEAAAVATQGPPDPDWPQETPLPHTACLVVGTGLLTLGAGVVALGVWLGGGW